MRSTNTRALVWVAAALTFALFGLLTGFFTLGKMVPMTTDMNPGLYSQLRYSFPPQAIYSMNYWLGQPLMPQDVNPMSLLALLPAGLFFSGFYPLMAALSLGAMYAFLREMNFRRGVALLGGILYAWQGDLFSNLIAGHFATATVWFLFALAAFCAARSARTGSWLLSACCGISLGMMVTVQADRGALCSLLIGGFYLLEIGRRWAVKAEALRHAGRLLLTVVIALAVAAPGVLSTVSALAVKSSPYGVETPAQKYEWATQWSYTPEDALNYFIPGFMGWRNGHDTGPYWGRIGQSAEWKESQQGMRNFCLAIFTIGTTGVVIGAIGFFCVAGGWWRRSGPGLLSRDQQIYGRYCAVAVVLGWLLALGKYGPLFIGFYQLPYMDTWRNPLKFLAPVSLALIFLAACGAQIIAALLENQTADSTTRLRRRIDRAFWWLLAGMAAVLVFSFPGVLPGTVWLGQLGYSPAEIGSIFSTLRSALFVAALCVGLCFWLWRLITGPEEKRRREFINPWIQRVWNAVVLPENWGKSWLAFAGALTVLQMFWVHKHYVELFNLDHYYGTHPLIQRLQIDSGMPHRVSIELGDPLLRQMISTIFPYHNVQCLDIPAASRIPDDYATLFKTLGTNRGRLWQLAGVKNYVTPMAALAPIQEDPTTRGLIGSIDYCALEKTQPPGPTHAIVHVKNGLPKVALIPRLEIFTDENELLTRLADPAWNPLDTVLALSENLVSPSQLKEAKNTKESPTLADADALKKLTPSVKLLRYTSRQIEVEVQTPTSSYLIVSDRYDRNWTATIDGKPATLFPADFILRGVAVPAGTSKVVMTYRVPMTTYYVQLAVLLSVAIWGVGRAVKRQRK